jgi:hypothetical protein
MERRSEEDGFDLLLDGEDLNLEQSVLYPKDIGSGNLNEH